jgi:hypothetical protein
MLPITALPNPLTREFMSNKSATFSKAGGLIREPRKDLKIFCGCTAKFNGFFTKDAVQSKTNHEKISDLKY